MNNRMIEGSNPSTQLLERSNEISNKNISSLGSVTVQPYRHKIQI